MFYCVLKAWASQVLSSQRLAVSAMRAKHWKILDFSRKLSELGSRLDFGVQGLGRGIGAAAGQKWSFRVRRMSISSGDGVPVLS